MRLRQYRWPGNVRELENLMRRLAALCPQEVITAEVIDAELTEAAPPAEAPAQASPDDAGACGGAPHPPVPRRA